MKKLLAMVLALVMTLSLAVSANAFKDDKSISDDYAEAVAVLNGMGVFKGYEDGSFQPKGDITRAEVSAIVYRVYTQDVKDAKASMYATYNKFSDMAGAGWAQGYIGYCANAELVKGYPDGTFKPSGKVTGYEVLAMILRAVGYDKNGEFSGADWALHVAQTAQQAGVLKNVKGVDLNAPASRELVAELLFRAVAESATVTYTPAFGYVTDKVLGNAAPTLGYKNFKLVGTDSADKWGRPATKWTYNVGDKETLVNDKPVVSYTTKVAECDIAKDLGISSAKKVEAGYIDGEKLAATDNKVSTNQVATINPLATTSYVGAQGRLTEVYDMGSDGYRIVEVNTYLAQVDKVTAATTDRNGHTTDATVDLTVFGDLVKGAVAEYTFKGVKAEGFTVDQYVLVSVLKPNSYKADAAKNGASVESIVAAEVVAGGKLTGWTNEVGTTAATSVVAGTTYNDANKFFLNRRAPGTTWLVALDAYGNAIGLVKDATSYAAVARIEWRTNSNSFGGYALADLVLADGTIKENVTVASVNDKSVNGVKYDQITVKGEKANATVALYWNNNKDYYNHVVTYSVNADGSYNLKYVAHNTDTAIADANAVNYKTGSARLGDFTATNNTVFLYQNDNGYSYTVYVGKDKAPSITNADMCVKYDSNSYAEFVVVTKYTEATNTFLAYVADGYFSNLTYPGDKTIAGYTVYKIGTTEATVVYDADHDNDGNVVYSDTFYNAVKAGGAGLYEIEVNNDSDMFVKSAKLVVASASKYDNQLVSFDYDYAMVGYVWHDMNGDSLQVLDDTSNYYEFNAAPDTTVINVTKYKNETILTKGSIADVKKDSKILFVYDDNSSKTATKLDVKVVYVLETKNDVATPVTEATLKLTSKQNTVNAVYTPGSEVETQKGTITFYYVDKDGVKVELDSFNFSATTALPYTVTVPAGGNVMTYDVYAVAKTVDGDVIVTSNTVQARA